MLGCARGDGRYPAPSVGVGRFWRFARGASIGVASTRAVRVRGNGNASEPKCDCRGYNPEGAVSPAPAYDYSPLASRADATVPTTYNRPQRRIPRGMIIVVRWCMRMRMKGCGHNIKSRSNQKSSIISSHWLPWHDTLSPSFFSPQRGNTARHTAAYGSRLLVCPRRLDAS